MSKEVKLDGVQPLVLPAQPKLVKKKYTITGEGAEQAAAQLKAQLQAQKGVMRLGNASTAQAKAGQQLATQQQSVVKQAVASNATSGIEPESAVQGNIAKATTLTQLQKITLPPGQFGKPDPKLLQSAMGKIGTGAATAAKFTEAGTVQQLIGELTAQVGEVGFLNDYQLMVLLIQMNLDQEKDNHAIRNSASTTEIAQAMLNAATVQIDNTNAKFDKIIDGLESINAYNEGMQSFSQEMAQLHQSLKEDAAKEKANVAEQAVTHANDDLAAASGGMPRSSVSAAAIGGVPHVSADKRTSEALVNAEKDAKEALAKASAADPVQAGGVSKAKAQLGKARAALVEHDAKTPGGEPGVPDSGRARIQRIVREQEGELKEMKPAGGKDAMAMHAALVAQCGVLSDLAAKATPVQPAKQAADTAVTAHLQAIKKATNSDAVAKRVAADAEEFRLDCGTADKDKCKAAVALHALVPDLVKAQQLTIQKRDTTITQVREFARDAAATRLGMIGTIPASGIQAAAAAHADRVAIELGSPTQTKLDLAQGELAKAKVAAPVDSAKIAAITDQIAALQTARVREKQAAAEHERILYGHDAPQSDGKAVPGTIETLAAMASTHDVPKADFEAMCDSLQHAGSTYAAVIENPNSTPAQRAAAEIAMSRDDDKVNRLYEQARFTQAGRSEAWPAHVQTLDAVQHAHEGVIAAQLAADDTAIALATARAQPTPDPAKIARLQAAEQSAKATLALAQKREDTLGKQSSYELGAGVHAPKKDEIAETQKLVGIGAPAGALTLLDAQAAEDKALAPLTAKLAALKAIDGTPQTTTDAAAKKTLEADKSRLAADIAPLQKAFSDASVARAALEAKWNNVGTSVERAAGAWKDPPPPLHAGVAIAGPPPAATWTDYDRATRDADAKVPPLGTQVFIASDALTNERTLRGYYAATGRAPAEYAAAKEAALTAAPAPAGTPEAAFQAAAQAVALHAALDDAHHYGTQVYQEHWTDSAAKAWAAANAAADSTSSAWAAVSGGSAPPNAADLQSKDPARQKAAKDYQAAQAALQSANESGANSIRKDHKENSGPLADPTSKPGILATVAPFVLLVGKGIQKWELETIGVRLRSGMDHVRDEAHQKASQLAAQARSSLLHAADGESGRWRATLELVGKLREDSVKGR